MGSTRSTPVPAPVIGQPPELAGLICEGLICEGFEADGGQPASANVMYLRFQGKRHRLRIDGGVIFWRQQDRTPEPWAMPEMGWLYPHVGIGITADVTDRRLDHYEMTMSGTGARVAFMFGDGPTVILAVLKP